MPSLKSRKALYAALLPLPGAKLPDNYRGLSNEVYGPHAYCYPEFVSRETRVAGENALLAAGFRVNRDYSPSGFATSVRVSYFRGLRWDE